MVVLVSAKALGMAKVPQTGTAWVLPRVPLSDLVWGLALGLARVLLRVMAWVMVSGLPLPAPPLDLRAQRPEPPRLH